MVEANSSTRLPAVLARYTIRESKRAKRLRLQLSVEKGLEVVVPRGFDHRQIPDILQEKRQWLERANQRIEVQRQRLAQDPPDQLPQTIELTAIEEKWQVEYHPTAAKRVSCREQPNHWLLVQGCIEETDACQDVLKQWLNHKGYQHLVPWLEATSQVCQLPFRKAFVKGQKTLWGSCSNQKNINLNRKLLFLPKPLVRYVFVHELCHTLELNHSAKFWQLVGEQEPQYKQLDADLKQAWQFVPTWAESHR